MNFPAWSDLGNPSHVQRSAWDTMLYRYEEYRAYYNGTVFQTLLDSEDPEEQVKRFPVGLNLVKMLCQAQADALFGEWDDQIVSFVPVPDDTGTDDAKSAHAACKVLSDILLASGFNSRLWEAALTREVYGGVPMMVKPATVYPHIRWVVLPLEGFYPIWDPDDEDVLLEVFLLTEMTADQARLAYNYRSTKEIVLRVEHWTRERYETFLDEKRLDAYSGVNPWGFVPVVYVPRMRSDNWWGDALTPELMTVQDELNDRIADIGDALNYNAHPTRWGINLPRSFKRENFPLGPNALWDLGRQIGSMQPAQVGMLEAKNPVPEQSFKQLNFVYDWARMSSFAPPVVFGQDEGSQRSGDTLEIRMWPLVKYVRRSRAYLTSGLARMIWMSGMILAQKSWSDVSSHAVRRMLERKVQPAFAPVLPRDHQTVVDEIVKLRSLEPPAISLETSQKELGRDAGEVQRIKDELQDTDLYPEEPDPMSETAGMNPGQPTAALKGKLTPQTKKEPADGPTKE
jgi:hypothetical protein